MKISGRPPITNPLLGFLLGLAAFLLSFIVELVIGPFAGTSWTTASLIGLTGLLMLLVFLGNYSNLQKLMWAGIGAGLAGFAGFALLFTVGYSQVPRSMDVETVEFLVLLAIAILYSSIFSVITFGPRSVGYFVLVFTLAAVPIGLLFNPLGFRSDLPVDMSRLIQRFTGFRPNLAFTYLMVGALSGTGIALFNGRAARDPTLKKAQTQ